MQIKSQVTVMIFYFSHNICCDEKKTKQKIIRRTLSNEYKTIVCIKIVKFDGVAAEKKPHIIAQTKVH